VVDTKLNYSNENNLLDLGVAQDDNPSIMAQQFAIKIHRRLLPAFHRNTFNICEFQDFVAPVQPCRKCGLTPTKIPQKYDIFSCHYGVGCPFDSNKMAERRKFVPSHSAEKCFCVNLSMYCCAVNVVSRIWLNPLLR